MSDSLLDLGTLDYILLGVLALIGVWYVWKKREEREEASSISSIQMTTISPAPQASKESSFVKKMKANGRNVVIFYGSQTGTAEELAGRLARECPRYGMKAMIADPEECDMEDLKELTDIPNHHVVFFLATYGEGDPTDNTIEFHEWLQGGADLTDVNYSVFGLGNKTYEHYNAFGIYVDKRLDELGNTRVVPIGLGDDDCSMEDDFLTWKEGFWTSVCEHFGVEALGGIEDVRQYKLAVHGEELPTNKVFNGEMSRVGTYRTQRPPFDAKNPFLAAITTKRNVFKSGERECLHIEVSISGSRIRYDAGDHVAVYPQNDTALVDKIGELCEGNLDDVISLVNIDPHSHKKHPFPCPTTYRTALSHYLDICSPVKTNFLKDLSEYASDADEKQMMLSMTSNTPEAKAAYKAWVIQASRTVAHILEDIPSCKPTIDHLCELLPRLQPRYYSISSSPKMYGENIHITAIVLEYETNTGRTNYGVCTRFLHNIDLPENIEEAPKLPVYVRKSTFRLPSRPTVPVIMIGPGTGFAPFRGFLQERQKLKEAGKELGEAVMYYGCRKQTEDFMYEEEMRECEADGVITKLRVAFSRDQEHKVYVQHLLEEDGEDIYRLISANANIYVCGDAKHMANDVQKVLIKIMETYGGKTSEEASKAIKQMIERKKYLLDVWS